MISSDYTEGPIQVDGRRYVTETHILDDGTELKFDWLGDQNAQPVMEARANLLQAQYDEKIAAAALVVGSKLPLTPLEFLKRIPQSKRIAMRERAKIDPIAEDIMRLFDAAKDIVTTDPETMQGIGYFQMVGDLTAEEVAVILE